MNIVVDGRPYAGGYSGYTTYLTSIIEPLLAAGWTVTIISNKPLNPVHSVAKHCEVKIFGSTVASLWEQWSVPRFLAGTKPDIYFVGANKGLPFWKARPTRYILALLDVIPYKFPRQYLLSPRYIIRELRPVAQFISIWRADALATISQASARDIAKIFLRPSRALLMRVAIEGTPTFFPEKPNKTFTYVGGVDGRKRLGELLQAFAIFSQTHADYRLVLIGRGYDEAYGEMMDELGIRGQVELTGFVDQTTKMQLIAQSVALVYPSLYEGYGLAIAEGFLAGVPVIAGAGGSQAEVGGEAVLYVDPLQPNDIAAAMEKILDPDCRKRLAAARKEQEKVIFGPSIDQNIQAFFAEQAGHIKETHS